MHSLPKKNRIKRHWDKERLEAEDATIPDDDIGTEAGEGSDMRSSSDDKE